MENFQTLEMLALEKITDPKGTEELNDAVVEMLVESIKEGQLIHPIVVDKQNNLITGRHRIEAFVRLNKKEIPAIIMDISANSEEAEVMHYEENLVRNHLSPTEIIKLIKKLENELIERQNVANPKKIRAELVKKLSTILNVGIREAQRKLQNLEKIAPEVLKRLQGTQLDRYKTYTELKNIPLEEQSNFIESKFKKLEEKKQKRNEKRKNKGTKTDEDNSDKDTPEENKQITPLKIIDETILTDLVNNTIEIKEEIKANTYLINFKQRAVYIDSWEPLEQEYDMKNHSYNEMVEHIKNRNKEQESVIEENEEIKEQLQDQKEEELEETA